MADGGSARGRRVARRPRHRFYQEIAATVAVRAPACYFAGIDEASGGFVVILQDLGPTSGISGKGRDAAADRRKRLLERFSTNPHHRHRPAGDPFGAGRFRLRAASLVGCDAQGIASSSLLAPNQNRRRADDPDRSKNALGSHGRAPMRPCCRPSSAAAWPDAGWGASGASLELAIKTV